jgi:hypothetical protein
MLDINPLLRYMITSAVFSPVQEVLFLLMVVSWDHKVLSSDEV